MKKLVTLLLAAGLVFSAANSASAVEVKTSGTMDFAFDWTQNIETNFQDYDDAGINQKHFGAVQRFRLGLEFVMSENLSATYQAQVGTFTWGGPTTANALGGNNSEGTGGVLGSRSANIVTRLAYLDWMVPNTSVKVRMGQQSVALPSFTFGSPVLDDTATGVVVAAPLTDNFGLTGLWLRADSGFRRGNVNTEFRADDNFDIFGLIGDVKGDGFQVQPWAVVGLIGKNAGAGVDGQGRPLNRWDDPKAGNATAWWAGISGELTMFDPFRLTADFMYSDVSVKHSKVDDETGWYAALGAEYKTAYGTPALKGWYASGDSKKHIKDGKRGGNLAELSGGFNATSTFYDGAFGLGKHIGVASPNGSWGISAQWNDISFVENLSHALSVTYVQGTNNKHNRIAPDDGYLTTKDSLVEIDFNTTYNIYQNLATVLELGYIFENFDGKNAVATGAFPATSGSDKAKFSNAWRASLNFQYTF